MSEYFQRVANDVLKASEELSIVLEDGIASMLGGASSSSSSTPPSGDEQDEFVILNEDEELIEEDLMNSPLQGMTDSVLRDIMASQAQPEGIWERLDAFRCAITWSEPFIIALVVFQLTMFVLCTMIISRPSVGLAPRLSIMIFIAVLVRSAEYWNQWANQHWHQFATQNYFDRQGVFMAVMVSAPLLFDCLIMLMLFVREAAQLLVTVKTNELKKKKAADSKKDNNKTKESKKEQ